MFRKRSGLVYLRLWLVFVFKLVFVFVFKLVLVLDIVVFYVICNGDIGPYFYIFNVIYDSLYYKSVIILSRNIIYYLALFNN